MQCSKFARLSAAITQLALDVAWKAHGKHGGPCPARLQPSHRNHHSREPALIAAPGGCHRIAMRSRKTAWVNSPNSFAGVKS
jgi:hypothetical protein